MFKKFLSRFFHSETTSNYVEVNGIRVHYLKSGFNPFVKVVFLHGLGGGSKVYSHTIELLSKKYEVYALDYPSFGETQLLDKPWEIKDFADLIEGFIRTLNLGRVVLIGHSAGGLISVEFSSRKDASKYIKKLVLIDSAGLQKSVSDLEFVFRLAFLNPMNHYFELRKNLRLNTLKLAIGNIFKMVGRSLKRKNVNIFKTLVGSWTYTVESKLRNIKVPTIILWGTDDELFPVAHAYYFKSSIKNSKLYFFKGFHNWVVFTPEIGEDVLLRKI
ncbi:alpha/beta hydrolase [Candidatus Woesearchaeota archaeon]|nr:alpha/beta hydrolase [Candidatus Woesearchaeota archaeon]